MFCSNTLINGDDHAEPRDVPASASPDMDQWPSCHKHSRASLLLQHITLSNELFGNRQILQQLSVRLRWADPRGLSEFDWNLRRLGELRRLDEEKAELLEYIAVLERKLSERCEISAEPSDELTVQIAASFRRLFADYRIYRRQIGYPVPTQARRIAR